MSSSRYLHIILVSICFLHLCVGEQRIFCESDFQEVVPIDYISIDLGNSHQRCYSKEKWEVAKEGEDILVQKSPKSPPDLPFDAKYKPINLPHEYDPSAAIKVDNGYLVAYNFGEFGSTVRFYSEDGKKSYWVSFDYVNQFRELNGQIFGIGGLQHLSLRLGKLTAFRKGIFGWKAKKRWELPQEGYDVCYNNGRYYILCEDCICVKYENLSSDPVEIIYMKRGFSQLDRVIWDGWSANSIQVKQDRNSLIFFIGCDIGVITTDCFLMMHSFGEENLYLPKDHLYFYNQLDEKVWMTPISNESSEPDEDI